jgi:hypothetical protein
MVTKQLYLVTIEDEDLITEKIAEATYSTPDSPKNTPTHDEVSMHALDGTSSGINTFNLRVKLGTNIATALMDCGSTTTFISQKIISGANLPITNHDRIDSSQWATLYKD